MKIKALIAAALAALAVSTAAIADKITFPLELSERTFEYEGYLRKQQDGFTPALHTLMHESYMLRGHHLLKVACHVRGLQEQRQVSEAIFKQADDDCTKIINSVTVYGK